MTREEAMKMAGRVVSRFSTHLDPQLTMEQAQAEATAFIADLAIDVERHAAERCQTLAIRMSTAPVPREEAYRTGIRYAAEEIAKGIGDTFGLEPRP